MRAAWYERKGPAGEVLEVGEMDTPDPGAGEVRIRIEFSGVNPGDVKKRDGWLGSPMPYPRVIPHSDGAGVIDAVGDGVDDTRIGERVWVYGAQSYRAFGTSAEAVVLPQELAVPLPDSVAAEVGASLGIPGITAHRAVFVDGPVEDKIVLVHGVLGAVSSLAAQLAHWGGARVIGTVRRADDLSGTDEARVPFPVVALDTEDPAAEIRSVAGDEVERIVDVALAANIDLDASLVAQGAVIATYASPADRTEIPFWQLLFQNTTLRLLGSDDFPAEAKAAAAGDLTSAAAEGALRIPVAPPFELERIASAHETVDAGSPGGRVVVHVAALP
jgi:NADPH2:quinone reductase